MEIWVQGQEPSEVPVRHSVTSTKKSSPAVARAPCTTRDCLDRKIQEKRICKVGDICKYPEWYHDCFLTHICFFYF